MAAATVANLLKIRKETIRKSLEHFQGIEHRLENVLTINKVRYINDSKATNINATYYALESMESPTVWIVGGIDKGNDYSGPHVCYRFWKNGKQVDPFKQTDFYVFS